MLNLTLKFDLSENAPDPRRQPALALPRIQRAFLQVARWKDRPYTDRPLISRHFTMERFLERELIQPQQPLALTAERVIHTAVRPVVRESLDFEHSLLSTPKAELKRESEPILAERQIPTWVATQRPAATTPHIPEVNIAQIADQVMRHLDHRISSWRERRGRS